MMYKTCNSCGLEKLISEFHEAQADCKPCRSTKDKKRYYENDRGNYLKRKYGITSQDYDNMYSEQEGSCAICGIHQSELKNRFCVDHDHDTGQVRGLLCNNCNNGIGKLQDNYDTIYRAADYLRAASIGLQDLSPSSVEPT